MPLNCPLLLRAPQHRSSRPMLMLMLKLMVMVVVVVLLSIMLIPLAKAHAGELQAEVVASDSEETLLLQLVHTQEVLIDTLRNFISTTESKLHTLKRKTAELARIQDIANNDTERYLNNPINSLTLIKRFTSDWHSIQRYAQNLEKLEEELASNATNLTMSLLFPNGEDMEEAASQLLRIQSIYQLEPQRLATGELHGVKLGSEMSWNDCVEIGRMSVAQGDYQIAKFWIETALEKLPTSPVPHPSPLNYTAQPEVRVAPSTIDLRREAEYEVLHTLLNVEFKFGHLEEAWKITESMLALKPNHKGVLKAQATIRQALNSTHTHNKSKKKMSKSKQKVVEKSLKEQLIEELCRGSFQSTYTSAGTHQQHCILATGNLDVFLIQPLKLEIISADPLVALYHDVLSRQQINSLTEFLMPATDNTDDEIGGLQFTPVGHKKLAKLVQRSIQAIIGHAASLFDHWQVHRFNFEDADELEQAQLLHPTLSKNTFAHVLLKLQPSKLGGSIAFPQLDLIVDQPMGSLLYWSNLNEFNEQDYRTAQHICPVIAGNQIVTYNIIRRP